MEDVHAHIEELVAEEHRLWQLESEGNGTDADRTRLEHVKVELDRYWDLLAAAPCGCGCGPGRGQCRSPERDDRRELPAVAMPACTHLDLITVTTLPEPIAGCEECLKTGDTWLHLRMCESCGKIGCCDSSPNKHASRHAREDGHPIARSAEPGEDWSWCYVDEVAFEIRTGDERS